MHLLRPKRGARRCLAARLQARPALLWLLISGIALNGCSSSDTAKSDSTAVTPVVLSPQDVVEAKVADIVSGVTLTGSLEPAEQATITAQVAGTLGPITVDRGSQVRRGQRLTTIRAAGVRSQAAGARASVAAAEAQLAMARTQRDAQQRLYEAGAVSRVQYENAQAVYAAAEAQVAAAKAQAAAAEEAAGYTVVTSPLTGIVSDRPADPGEAVASGDPILTVVNTSTLELTGRVPVDAAGSVRVGQPVTFRLDAFPGREFRGTVARKDPAADPASRQVGIYVRLPNSRGEITAGQYARGQVSGDRVEGAVTVPATAVQGTDSSAAVFVVASDRLVRRRVTLGPTDEGAGIVAVSSGLSAGERVLVRPTPSVTDGQPIVVATDRGSAAPVAAPYRDSGRASTPRE